MVSFRFPFSFSQPPRATSFYGFRISVVAASVTVGVAAAGAAIAASPNPKQSILVWDFFSHRSSLLPWGSISLADSSSESVVEPKTGFSFPASIGESQQLLGVGLRKKSLVGLKNIDVYAFGVYADCDDVKKLVVEKYANFPASEIIGNKAFFNDLMEADIKMTVSFTSLFKDEYKIPRNSTIDLTQEPGHVLSVSIEGNNVGSVKSKLLCKSILDLYIGEDPFDKKAREEASLAEEFGLLKLTDAEPTATRGIFAGWDDLEGTMTGCKWWFVGKIYAGAGCIK